LFEDSGELLDNETAVRVDALEAGHVLVLQQHTLGLRVVPGGDKKQMVVACLFFCISSYFQPWFCDIMQLVRLLIIFKLFM